MAAQRGKRELRELAAFVNALADRAGYSSSAAWARDANYPEPNLSRLRAEKASIDGYNLLRLIKAASVRIHEEEVALALTVSPPRADLSEVVSRLEAVVARLTAHRDDPPDAQAGEQPS